MEIRQLGTFLKVVQLQSFSKAAEELGYSQSAVTVQIHLLEEELHTRLFDRMGKKIALTPPGKTLLHYANHILQQVNEAQVTLGKAEHLSHPLHIGTIESLCFAKLPKVLEYFYKHHPQVSIKITTASPAKLIDLMEHNQVDIIYLLDQQLYNNNWVKVLEEKEYIVFVASTHSPLALQANLSLNSLLNQPFLLTEKEGNYRYRLNQYLAARKLSLEPFLEVANTEFIINMIKKNLGLSFLPHFAVQDSVLRQELAILNVTDFEMSMYRQIFYHKDKWVTQEMEEFIRLAKLGMV